MRNRVRHDSPARAPRDSCPRNIRSIGLVMPTLPGHLFGRSTRSPGGRCAGLVQDILDRLNPRIIDPFLEQPELQRFLLRRLGRLTRSISHQRGRHLHGIGHVKPRPRRRLSRSSRRRRTTWRFTLRFTFSHWAFSSFQSYSTRPRRLLHPLRPSQQNRTPS
jgi:hypothetical protein